VTNSSLATTFGGEVVDVLPNGMLVVQATRQLTFSQQTQLIRLRGLVRPEDVSAQNQVQSAAMTDLELEVTGTQSFINGETPSNFYSNLVSTLGATVSETTIQGTALSASVSQLQTQRDSLSSVSLNEEAASLQQFQRSYQAASQVFGILNSVYASALNLGVVTSVA
jgi:flagellar hook-associated protein FlgK